MVFDVSGAWPGWGLLKTTVTVGLAVLVYKLIVFTLRIRSLYKALESCPQLDREHFSWIHGNLHKMPADGEARLQFFDRFSNLPNGGDKMAVFWVGPFTPRLFLHHPDTMKEVFHTADPKPIGFMGAYNPVLPWLGEGLLLSGGQRWARSRRLLTPAFHFEILRSYISVFNDGSKQFLANIDPYADSGKSFDLFGPVSLCALDVLLRCALSQETNCQISKETVPYVTAVNELATSILQRMGKIWMYSDFLFGLSHTGKKFFRHCDYVHKFSQDIIQKRKESIKIQGQVKRKYLDFLDILLTARDENGDGLTDIEMQNEVDTFLFAGHDTTTSAISWIIYTLAQHQDYQERVFLELEELMTGRGNEEVLWEDLNRIPVLTMCIKECMRLHPPVPFIGRLVEEDRKINGVIIPGGNNITLNIYSLHRNPDLWDKPSEFIPERFSKENITDRDPFLYTPFAAGPRNCIGQNFAMGEIKVFLTKLFYRYRVQLDSSHVVRRSPEMVMRAQDGIKVIVSRRS
ncbi:hypothetical protein ScPMuIL_007961 [Solemya velum]